MMKNLPLTRPVKHMIRAGFALSAVALIGAAAAQSAPNLIAQERNYAVLNDGNFEDRLYTIPTPGNDATQFRFKLKGYVFGIRMIRANFTGYTDDNAYAAYSDIKTSGLGALLKKMEIWSVTKGAVTANGLRPDYHVQQNLNKKNRRVEMNYDNAARNIDIQIIPPNGSFGTPPATPEQQFGSLDVISAIMSMMEGGLSEEEVCNRSVPVFDSKQHYNLRMEKVGNLLYKYDGEKLPAVQCHVFYEPVSGFDPEDLPDSEEGGTPVNVYFTKMEDINMWVPLKFTYKISSIKASIKVDKMLIIAPDQTVEMEK